MIESVLICALVGSVSALAFIAFIHGPEIVRAWRGMRWRR